MADWKTPGIYVGGIFVPAQQFSWSLTPGVLPYTNSFTVPQGPINDALLALANPVTLKLVVTGGTTGAPDPWQGEFKRIHLLEPKYIDPYHVLWTVADTRWEWRGLKLYFSYNKTRQKNEVGIGTTSPSTDPASLRTPFDTFGVGRYLKHTINTNKPWNMKEIIELVLEKLFIPLDKAVSDDAGAYILENIEQNGADIYSGLAQLLSSSRLNLGIKTNGEAYVYSTDYFDNAQFAPLLTWQTLPRTSPGILYTQDNSRMRPKKINVRFERKEEIRVVAGTLAEVPADSPIVISPNPPVWTQQDIDNWRVIGCENVMPVPLPVTSAISGREFQIGEWIPIFEYIQSLPATLTDAQIRTAFFAEKLERILAKAIAAAQGTNEDEVNEVYTQQIVSAIKAHYRQTYRFDPFFVDRIESWEPKRVAVLDNYWRFSPPSPLFADYCVIPRHRHPSLAKRSALWDVQAYNRIVTTTDPKRQFPTPGTVSVVNGPLGIFRVSYPPPTDMVVKRIIPSALDNPPYTSLVAADNLLVKSTLSSAHTLDTVISVVWHTDRLSDFGGPNKYYHVNLDFTNEGGKGPDLDYLSTTEHARLQVREINTNNTIKQDPDVPVNLGILEAIAKAEAGKLMNQFKDRPSGYLTLAGYHSFKLLGHMRAITYSFSPARGFETVLDMRSQVPDPTLEQQLPQKVIDFLNRHVSRGDNKNEMVS
jgi:hypothetical protein